MEGSGYVSGMRVNIITSPLILIQDMIVNLVSKYGIVPQVLYPDSWNAQNSRTMNLLITAKLRENALILREAVSANTTASKLTELKEGMMQDIVRIVTFCLGPPPPANEKFTWEFYDSAHKLQTVSMTPIEFAESTHVKKFFSLVNDPRNEYNRLLTVDHLGNVWDGQPITYVNVDKQVLKDACIEMLKKGLPIFFGSDVGKQSDRDKGIMATDLVSLPTRAPDIPLTSPSQVDYELGFNVKLGLNKADRLRTGESAMTHAMVLTAVHLDANDKPVRWRVENSWSEKSGSEGYFVMSDNWMDEFCYQAVIDPEVVSQEVRDVLQQKPKVLPLWDPMGALA